MQQDAKIYKCAAGSYMGEKPFIPATEEEIYIYRKVVEMAYMRQDELSDEQETTLEAIQSIFHWAIHEEK